jgi:hypothetical protein
MSKYKTSINTTAKLAPDLKRYCSHLQELLQNCGKIMANMKKQNNLLSLLGLNKRVNSSKMMVVMMRKYENGDDP